MNLTPIMKLLCQAGGPELLHCNAMLSLTAPLTLTLRKYPCVQNVIGCLLDLLLWMVRLVFHVLVLYVGVCVHFKAATEHPRSEDWAPEVMSEPSPDSHLPPQSNGMVIWFIQLFTKKIFFLSLRRKPRTFSLTAVINGSTLVLLSNTFCVQPH